jgi:hypothetical protein
LIRRPPFHEADDDDARRKNAGRPLGRRRRV